VGEKIEDLDREIALEQKVRDDDKALEKESVSVRERLLLATAAGEGKQVARRQERTESAV